MDIGQVSLVVRCNCSLPDGSDCEFVVAVHSPENAETMSYTHLRTAHPDRLLEEAWSETVGRLIETGAI